MAIIDQYGNPFNLRDLKEPQTAKIAVLQNEVMRAQTSGLTPGRAASLLREADAGDIVAVHQLFEDMKDSDAHLICEYEKRCIGVQKLDWKIVPRTDATTKEKADAEWCAEFIRFALDDFEDLLLAMMDAVGHGFAPIELEWQQWGRDWLPAFHPRPQTWFQTDLTRRELRLRNGTGDGEAMFPLGWIMHHAHKVKTGYLGRMGLVRVLLWPYLYKAYSVGDFSDVLRMWGMPVVIGKYPTGAKPEEKASLLRSVAALGRDGRAIMPEGMLLDVQKIASEATGSPHAIMMKWADDAESKAILGQISSADARPTGMGSGVAELHGEVRDDIMRSDARQIASTLTRDLVYPLLTLNRGLTDLRRTPRFEFDTTAVADLGTLADALPKLATHMRISAAWVREKTGIPAAAPDEELFGTSTAPPEATANARIALKIAPARSPATTKDTAQTPADTLNEAVDRLEQEAAPLMREWVDTLAAILGKASSLDEARAMLLAAYPELDTDAMANTLGTAFAALDLQGRADVAGRQ